MITSQGEFIGTYPELADSIDEQITQTPLDNLTQNQKEQLYEAVADQQCAGPDTYYIEIDYPQIAGIWDKQA